MVSRGWGLARAGPWREPRLLPQTGGGQESTAGRANVVAQMSPGEESTCDVSKREPCSDQERLERREASRQRGVRDSTPPLSEPHQRYCGQVKLQAAAEGAGSQLCLQSRCFLLMHMILSPSLVHPHDIPGEYFSNIPISQVSSGGFKGVRLGRVKPHSWQEAQAGSEHRSQ